MRYVEIYGFNGRENGGIARLTVVNFDLEKNDYKSFFQREFAVSRKREPLGKNTALPY